MRYLLAFLFATSLHADEQQGVPITNEDYTVPVEQWWDEHPLNPRSANFADKIQSPEPVVDAADYDFDIQRAIDSLPEEGGTVKLSAGNYRGGFRILARKNVHLLGEGEVIIRGGDNYVIGSSTTFDYGKFCSAVDRKDPEAVAALTEAPTRNLYFKGLAFDDSPVRLAACEGVLFDDCIFEKIENREVGDKDAREKKVLRWYRPLPVTGIMGIRHIWFRGCDFRGHHANAYYLDGAHWSGVLNCKFAGSSALWHNAILLFTNDDLSLDLDGDNALAPAERRDTRYYIVDGCEFGGGYARGAVAASGRDILIQDCDVIEPLGSLLVINAKTSGKDISYEAFGIKVRNNNLNKVSSIITAEGAKNRPEKGVPDWWKWTKYEIGKFEITDNRISETTTPIREIPNDSEILGPHKIENNGPSASGAGEAWKND